MSTFQTTRRGILGLIGGLAIFRSAPASAPGTFTLVPGLEAGQTIAYRLDQQVVRNGSLAHRSSARVTVSIVDRVEGGWLARWTTNDSQLLDADPRMKPLLQAMQRAWDGVPIDVLLDTAGRVSGLADVAALRDLMGASMERLLAAMANDPALAPLLGTVRAALQPVLANDTYIAQAVLKELGILLGAMGREYKVGTPLEVRTRIASPLGTGEIPILGRFTIRAVDPRAHQAKLGWLMVIDRRSAARLMSGELQETMEQLAAGVQQDGTPIDTAKLADAATAALDFDDQGEFEIDTATAWPARVRHTRRVSNAETSRVDTVELIRI